MSKRLVRAKQKIRYAGIPYRVPPVHLLPERTPAVLAALYLLFNEGYSASAGSDLQRRNPTAEAIRLARVLVRLMPDQPEAVGLLALMLPHEARAATRLDDAGDLVPLEEQDRGQWDDAEIAEGVALLDGALRRGQPGPYQLQAPIAAYHATAADATATDWAQIAALYGQLVRLATKADLLRRLDRTAEAAAAYRLALQLVATDTERRFLQRRLAETIARS